MLVHLKSSEVETIVDQQLRETFPKWAKSNSCYKYVIRVRPVCQGESVTYRPLMHYNQRWACPRLRLPMLPIWERYDDHMITYDHIWQSYDDQIWWERFLWRVINRCNRVSTLLFLTSRRADESKVLMQQGTRRANWKRDLQFTPFVHIVYHILSRKYISWLAFDTNVQRGYPMLLLLNFVYF